ncbi:Hypothetical predicted protein, partial [Paramuricea clavata]
MYISTLLIAISNDVATNPGPGINVAQQLSGCRGLKISHLNIRSLYPKMDEVRLLLKDQPIDVFTISETWLNPSISDEELSVPGYTILRQDRLEQIGGGTAMYIRDGLPYCQRFDITDDSHLECCWVEITRPKTKKLIICSTYRAPNFPITTFVESFDASLSKIPENAELVVLGDFNVDFN